MSKTRVLFIVPEYPPYATGGGGVAFSALARGFVARGYHVRVFAGNQAGCSYEHTYEDVDVRGIALMRFPKQPAYLSGYLPPWDISGFLALPALARESDIVHIHGIGLPFCDLSALLLRSYGISYYLTNHGYPRRPGQSFAPLRTAFCCYERIITEAAVAGAKKCSAISAFCAADGPLRAKNATVIGNGIDAEYVRADIEKDGRASDELLFVGRLQEDKGILLLIEALALVSGMRLRVIGADFGAKATALALTERLGLKERITFAGLRTQSQIFKDMRESTAVVFPSLNEPFGLVGLEAMANGALLVTSDEGGMRSYADEQTALLFRRGDVDDLARVLSGLPLDPQADRTVRLAARDRAAAMIWPRVVESYLTWYAT